MDIFFSTSLVMLAIVVFFVASFFGVVAYYYANRKKIVSGELYKETEPPPPSEPYKTKEEAKRAIQKETIKPFTITSIYFISVVLLLNIQFGKIQYGANLPYLVSLAAVGIPFLICFVTIMTRIDSQRERLVASGVSNKDIDRIARSAIILLPLTLLLIIRLSIKLSHIIIR